MAEEEKKYAILFAYPDSTMIGNALVKYGNRLQELCPEAEIVRLTRASAIPSALEQAKRKGQKVLGILSHNTEFDDGITAVNVKAYMKEDSVKSALMGEVGINEPPEFIVISAGANYLYDFHPLQLFWERGPLIGLLDGWRRQAGWVPSGNEHSSPPETYRGR